jgi:L-threonylcarbamoyladenylate synthase
MSVETLTIDDSQAIPRAITVLQAGGVIAFPTDTVYGIAALVERPEGIQRLYQVKSRDALKAIPILIGDRDQLQQLSGVVPPAASLLAAAFWPGALTLIIPRAPHLPQELSSYPTIGVRLPAHDFVQQLASQAGPLAATSANRSGEENPLSAQDVLHSLGAGVDLVIDGGRTPGNIASSVVDCTVSPPVILREGVIPAEEIYRALSLYRE